MNPYFWIMVGTIAACAVLGALETGLFISKARRIKRGEYFGR